MRAEIYTYFTIASPQSQLLYSANSPVVAKLRLETAGPVAVSTRESVVPVLSGKGILLPTGEEYDVRLDKGDRLFIAAEAVNRVSFSIEPNVIVEIDGKPPAAPFPIAAKPTPGHFVRRSGIGERND